MKATKKYNADEERTVLAALIMRSKVLERVSLHLKGEQEPFRSRWSNIIAKWCFDHFDAYKKAPRKAVRELFVKYAQGAKDSQAIETIETFLEGLSSEFGNKQMDNDDFLVDLASNYFRRVRLEKTIKGMEAAMEAEKLDKAEALVSSYQTVSFGSGDWIDPTRPEEIIEALSDTHTQELIQFRGALGEFLSPHFERDAFISFVGPEKRGKSFWLLETAWQAMIQRRKVLYYVIGDMSRHQVMRRLITRATKRPMRLMKIERPVEIKKGADRKVEVETETIKIKDLPTVADAAKAMRKILQRTGAIESRMKLKCCGGSTISATDIERDIGVFARQGWIPDVAVIDYADLLMPEAHAKSWDYRHQINETWKILRRIAQVHRCLVVTGTQSAATAYDAWVIRKSDFSEDKRKNAHVTGMLGINQTSEEKEQGVYRLNWVFLRDGKWTDTQVVYTAGNLALACPCMISTL